MRQNAGPSERTACRQGAQPNSDYHGPILFVFLCLRHRHRVLQAQYRGDPGYGGRASRAIAAAIRDAQPLKSAGYTRCAAELTRRGSGS